MHVFSIQDQSDPKNSVSTQWRTKPRTKAQRFAVAIDGARRLFNVTPSERVIKETKIKYGFPGIPGTVYHYQTESGKRWTVLYHP